MPDPTKTESADKTETKKDSASDKPNPFETVHTGDKQQQAADNAALIKKGDTPTTVKLPDTKIVGDAGDKAIAAPGSEAAASWSNRKLPDVIKFLDSIKASAEQSLKTVTSAGDRAQRNTYELLKDTILPKLKKEGKLGGEWELYPSVKLSPADKIGADFLLVNRKTGEFHFIDPTLNTEKKNVFELRRGGVILVESDLFDKMGALKTDEGGTIGERAVTLQTNIENQVVSLAKTPSVFKLGPDGMPMPDMQPTANGQEQINQTAAWAKKQASESAGAAARNFNEMATVITGAETHTKIAAVEVHSQKFDESVRKVTEAEVAKFAFAKYKKQEYQEVKNNGSGTEVKIIKGDLKLHTQDDQRLTGGKIQTHLEESWGKLLNTKTMLSTLSNKDLKSMGADTKSFDGLKGEERATAIEKAYRSQPKFRVEADKLRDTLHSLRSTIVEGGGSTGGGDRVLEGTIVNKLKSRTEENLLAKPPKSADSPAVVTEGKPAAADQTAKAASLDKLAPKAFAELESYHQGETFQGGKASQSLSETMQLLLLDQEAKREQAAKGQASADQWPATELESFKKLTEAYKDSQNPGHDAAVKQVHEWFNKRSETPDTQDAPKTKTINVEAELKGNPTFEKLTDATRMEAALKQLTERGLQNMADKKTNSERGEYLTQQLKAAMRKQLGVSTDAELPESIRKMQIKVVDGAGNSPRVAQNGVSDPANIEISAKLLQDNPKAALAEAYTHASGLSMIDILRSKGNEGVTLGAIKPMLDKIAHHAETVVGAQATSIASREKPALSAEQASSDRKIVLDAKKPLVTTFDGENLSFGGEKFHVKSEIAKLEKERGERVKDLESMAKRAKELADTSKSADDIGKLKLIESQLATAKQSLQVVTELNHAMTGARGASAQLEALKLVKTAADRAIADRMAPREGGGGVPLSRGAAIAMVVTTLAFMYVGNAQAARADEYEGSFHK